MMSLSMHQRVEINKKLASHLQERMSEHFFDHATHGVNDSLTSILALCDIEQMKTIPKIKQYINHINEILNDVKIYQNKNVFNINDVVENLIGVIEGSFTGKVDIFRNLADVKALVKSDQPQMENILLYIFAEVITGGGVVNSDESDLESAGRDFEEIHIDLHQKGKDAQIIIKKDFFVFTDEALGEVDLLKEGFSGKIHITQKNNYTEIDIRVPLCFETPKEPTFSVNKPSIKVKSIKPISIGRMINEKERAK